MAGGRCCFSLIIVPFLSCTKWRISLKAFVWVTDVIIIFSLYFVLMI